MKSLLLFLLGWCIGASSAIAGQFEIGGAGDGLILISPNGTRYKVTVSNLGLLAATAI